MIKSSLKIYYISSKNEDSYLFANLMNNGNIEASITDNKETERKFISMNDFKSYLTLHVKEVSSMEEIIYQ